MLRISLLAVFAGVALAQSAADQFNRPPVDVDQALRARITEFYQYHVKQEYRKAESLVAEDTKDFFYSHNKPSYLSFEISRIDYSENYTKAKAVVICELYVMMPGFADKPVKAPTPSTWKLVDGKWYWYVDQEALRQSPFGKMTAGTKPSRGSLPTVIPDTADFVMNKVKADRDSVALKVDGVESVTISNSLPGMAELSVTDAPAGIEAKLDRTSLNFGEKAVLTLRAKPGAKDGRLHVGILPTGEAIEVKFTVPPELTASASPGAAPANAGATDPLKGKVKADRESVALKRGTAKGVTITNSAPGVVELSVADTPPGIAAQLNRASLKAGEKAVLTLRAGKGAKAGRLHVRVLPTGETIEIRFSVQ